MFAPKLTDHLDMYRGAVGAGAVLGEALIIALVERSDALYGEVGSEGPDAGVSAHLLPQPVPEHSGRRLTGHRTLQLQVTTLDAHRAGRHGDTGRLWGTGERRSHAQFGSDGYPERQGGH